MSVIALDQYLGAVFVGIVVSSIIYGITCLQIWFYFTRHGKSDQMWLKAFVIALMALDTLHVILIAHAFYQGAVIHFGDYNDEMIAPWSLIISSTVGVLSSSLIQLLYANRIYRMLCGKSKYLVTIVIIFFSIAAIALNVQFTRIYLIDQTYAKGRDVVPYAIAILSVEVVSDVIITSSMVSHLWRSKKGFSSTNAAVNNLIGYSVNSGAFSAILSIACLTAVLLSPLTLVYLPFFYVLVRVHTCSFMSILNSRQHLWKNIRRSVSISDGALNYHRPVTVTVTQSSTVKVDEPVEMIEHKASIDSGITPIDSGITRPRLDRTLSEMPFVPRGEQHEEGHLRLQYDHKSCIV